VWRMRVRSDDDLAGQRVVLKDQAVTNRF
jgi:hypothetical protein